MNVKRFYAGLIGLVLTGGLAACGSAAAPRAAPPRAAVTVTASPAPTVSVTSAPTPTVTKTVVVVPARTAYAPAAPALTNCGGVYAGPNTSCPFAVKVKQTWLTSGATDTFSVYSPVTGQSYIMTCSGINPTLCTGGNDALVEFYG